MSRCRQRGATMVLVVIGLAALIGMAGLALDTSHVLLNKSRLQSSLDAAALAAAKMLDQSGSTILATTAANNVFALNLAQYPELQTAVSGGLAMTSQYSATLIPFAAGTVPARFVRTSVVGFTTQMSLVSVLGVTSMNVGGTAVAGPSPSLSQACNIVPIMLCGNAAAAAPLFGYAVGQVLGLNRVPASNPTGPELGPGNYNLLSVGGTGGSVLRDNFAGDYSACATIGNNVTTEPGVAAGPVTQGVNTRFNQYSAGQSAADYPPDVINSAAHQTSLTTDPSGDIHQGPITNPTAAQLTFNWSAYNALQPTGPYDTQPMPGGTGAFRRREVAAPIGDCSSAVNGRGSINVLGFACLYLLQEVNNGGKHVLYAQVLQTCDAGGRPGAGSGSIGPHVIQLYKSAGSPDS